MTTKTQLRENEPILNHKEALQVRTALVIPAKPTEELSDEDLTQVVGGLSGLGLASLATSKVWLPKKFRDQLDD